MIRDLYKFLKKYKLFFLPLFYYCIDYIVCYQLWWNKGFQRCKWVCWSATYEVCSTTRNKLGSFVYGYSSDSASETKTKVFCRRWCLWIFPPIYDWNRATIQEKLWIRMKFTQMAQTQAYSFCGRKFKPTGVSPACGWVIIINGDGGRGR